MRQLITVLVILLAIAILANCKTSVQLSGRDGASLLNNLTNNSTNLSSSNSTRINLSHSATTMHLGGNDGTALLENLTNGPDGANNTTDDLSTWGSKPRPTPPPPTYDYKEAQLYEVLRQNHLGAQA
jgi:hypothetical protein